MGEISKFHFDVGQVQFGISRIWNPVISKLDKHVVMLPINHIASKHRLT